VRPEAAANKCQHHRAHHARIGEMRTQRNDGQNAFQRAPDLATGLAVRRPRKIRIESTAATANLPRNPNWANPYRIIQRLPPERNPLVSPCAKRVLRSALPRSFPTTRGF